eukprot:scaffold407_cov251-Pinguiococcus_pyrenoidosus.AAC.26
MALQRRDPHAAYAAAAAAAGRAGDSGETEVDTSAGGGCGRCTICFHLAFRDVVPNPEAPLFKPPGLRPHVTPIPWLPSWP